MSCEFLPPTPTEMPGWGCCRCRTFNGLQRRECKRCGHTPCAPLPTPGDFNLCDECGVPRGARHQGHANGAVFGSDKQTVFTAEELARRS
jgi:hypothetical protein